MKKVLAVLTMLAFAFGFMGYSAPASAQATDKPAASQTDKKFDKGAKKSVKKSKKGKKSSKKGKKSSKKGKTLTKGSKEQQTPTQK